MRTYRCTARECGETFDVERHRDRALPASVVCCFCGGPARGVQPDRMSVAEVERLRESGRRLGTTHGREGRMKQLERGR